MAFSASQRCRAGESAALHSLEFASAAALDATAPGLLKTAGQKVTSRQLVDIAEEVEGKKFKLTWAGNLAILGGMIKLMRQLRSRPE